MNIDIAATADDEVLHSVQVGVENLQDICLSYNCYNKKNKTIAVKTVSAIISKHPNYIKCLATKMSINENC